MSSATAPGSSRSPAVRPRYPGGAAVNQFNTFASFLLGLPTGVSKSLIPFEEGFTRSRNWQFSFFAKDQWQPTRKLTASLGLRYDYFPMGTRTTRGLERYDLETNTMLICGVGSMPTDCGYDMPAGNVSPRLGLAYRLTDESCCAAATASTTTRIRWRLCAICSATILPRSA